MAEHINSVAMLSSGGHKWLWGPPNVIRKRLGAAAIVGEYSMVTSEGARGGRIVGRDGGNALLSATGATRALADAALNVLADALEALEQAGDEVAWEDDEGRSGTALVVTEYAADGTRQYGTNSGGWTAWQPYALAFLEMNGRR